MAKIFQKPEGARGAHAGQRFVDDDLFLFGHTAQLEEVEHHPHESFERVRPRVDQADAKEVEVNRPGNMAFGKFLRSAGVDEAEIGVADLLFELIRSCEQDDGIVIYISHSGAIAIIEFGLNAYEPRSCSCS